VNEAQIGEERLKEFELWLRKRNKAEKTIEERLYAIRKWLSTGQSLEDYLLRLKERSVSGYNMCLRAVRLLERCLGFDLAKDFVFIREPEKPVKPPSIDQMRMFFAGLSPRDQAVFMVLAKSGLRPYEALHLKPENVDLSSRTITVYERPDFKVKNTGAKMWFTFLDHEGLDFLAQHLGQRKEDDYLFQVRGKPMSTATLDTMFHKNAKRTGVEITPYDLRKWFENRMRMHRVSSEDIDFFAGRSQKSILGKHYLAYEGELRDIYDSVDLRILSNAQEVDAPLSSPSKSALG